MPEPRRDYRRSRVNRMMRVAFAAGAAGVVLLATKVSTAQEWTKDRRIGDGKGWQTGDFELHPGIGAEFGYDSNYFLRSDANDVRNTNSAPAAPVRDGEVLRITPSVTFNTVNRAAGVEGAGQPSFALKGGLFGSYWQFFGAKELSDQSNATAGANVRLDILPNRPVGAAVFVNYARALMPNAANGNPDNAYTRDQIGGGAEVIAMPGGGTFDIRGGYAFYAELFEQTAGVPYTNFKHEISIRDRWRFRPRTALFHDTAIDFVTYPNSARATNLIQNSTPLTSRIGLTGLITPRFSALAAVGYGTTLELDAASKTTTQYDSVIANAEATFFLSSNPADNDPGQVSLSVSTLTLGYARDFQKSLITGYYGSDRGYATLSYFFANRALIQLSASVGAVEYPTIWANPAGAAPVANAFTDIRFGSKIFGEYRFLDSLAGNLTLAYDQNFSSTVLDYGAGVAPAPGTPAAARWDMAWKRFQAFIGIRYFL
jgi:hypothetical protein